MRDLPKFAERLKRERLGRRLTMGRIAARCGITSSNYNNIEKGRCLPSLVLYGRICRTLRVSAGKLLE